MIVILYDAYINNRNITLDVEKIIEKNLFNSTIWWKQILYIVGLIILQLLGIGFTNYIKNVFARIKQRYY